MPDMTTDQAVKTIIEIADEYRDCGFAAGHSRISDADAANAILMRMRAAIAAALAAERERCLGAVLAEIDEGGENMPYRVATAIQGVGRRALTTNKES